MFANFAPQQQLNLPLLHILIFFLFLLFVLQNGISGHDLSRGRRFNALKAKGSPKIERRIKRLRCIEEAINPLKIKGPPKAVAPPKTVGTFLLAAEKDSVTWKKTTMMPAKGLGMKSSSNSANPTITTRLISSLHLPIVNADYYYGGDYGVPPSQRTTPIYRPIEAATTEKLGLSPLSGPLTQLRTSVSGIGSNTVLPSPLHLTLPIRKLPSLEQQRESGGQQSMTVEANVDEQQTVLPPAPSFSSEPHAVESETEYFSELPPPATKTTPTMAPTTSSATHAINREQRLGKFRKLAAAAMLPPMRTKEASNFNRMGLEKAKASMIVTRTMAKTISTTTMAPVKTAEMLKAANAASEQLLGAVVAIPPPQQQPQSILLPPLIDDPLQMTLSNCQKMDSFSHMFGVTDPRTWVRTNCFLLQFYVRASCDEIDRFVASCSKYEQQQKMAPKSKR